MELNVLYNEDCIEGMRKLPENSVDAVVTDPPYGIAFMCRKWDYDVPSVQIWEEVCRVLKPGGHLLSFGSTRTYHRMLVNIEDAGFEPRDTLTWHYASGFPKSLDVSKSIDKSAGAKREIVGTTRGNGGQNFNQLVRTSGSDNDSAKGCGAYGLGAKQIDIDIDVTVAATPEAKQWQGWGTALKPATELIALARKPLSEGTVAANVLKHGTGALNIDASRVPTSGERLNGGRISTKTEGWDRPWKHDSESIEACRLRGAEAVAKAEALGRWPSNVIHDGSDEVLQFFPSAPGQIAPVSGNEPSSSTKNAYSERQRVPFNAREGETSSAARFFYCAKASRSERGEGNAHPTVKPIALMEYLVRLITPLGGVVLDPFAGSGTTLLACAATGAHYVGFERDTSYFEIAQKRIAEHAPQLSLVRITRVDDDRSNNTQARRPADMDL